MKTKIRLLIWAVLLSYSLTQTPLRAQWTPVLTHDSLTCLAVINSDTVFAAGNNAILRTFDGGETWQNVLPANIEISVFDMELAGNAIYVSGNGKILKTTDNGNSWTIVRQNPGVFYKKLSFANSSHGLALAKGTTADTLLRTNDGGLTWQAVPFTFPAFSANAAYSMQLVDKSVGYFLTDKLYKTTDGGDSWVQLSSFGTNMPMFFGSGNLIGFSNPDTGIILSYDYSDWKKTIDGGNTWEVISRVFYTATGICALHPDVYYISIADGYFYSGGNYVTTDAGTNWESQSLGNYGRDIAMATDSIGYYLASNIYYNTGVSKVFRTIHGGWTWTGIDEIEPANATFYNVAPNPATDYLTFTFIKTIDNDQFRVEVSNASGEILLTLPLTNLTRLTIDKFKTGTYLYAIKNQNKTVQTGKFIKY